MNNTKVSLPTSKTLGRIYTPNYIVRNILDLCGYTGERILGKYVIDNSCGDGAFLKEVVARYCESAIRAGMHRDRIAKDLSSYVHGIEIDPVECERCRTALSEVASKFDIQNNNWHILCQDALTVSEFDRKMDYVVGNPPYVRVHNLQESYRAVKNYTFAQNGMTDLFIVFYEIGLNMLNQTGVLGYISPSSFFTSVAGRYLRTFLYSHQSIRSVVDLKHFQPFSATTYTTIVILTANPNDQVEYYVYDSSRLTYEFVSTLTYPDFSHKDYFIFGNKEKLNSAKRILSYEGLSTDIQVKNGFATLCDSCFIGNFPFEEYTIPVVKASTGMRTKCLYPYDMEGRLIPYEELEKNTQIRNHYEKHSEKLKRRNIEKNGTWYGFGRSQAIKDVFKKKYSINTLLRNPSDLKLIQCDPGVGVYSGLYILTNHSFDDVHSCLFSEEFYDYISLLGKYKSGGYYTFSSKDLNIYLNYKFAERREFQHEQLRFS